MGLTLTAAEVLRLLAACVASSPVAGDAPPARVQAIAQHESHFQVFAVGVNADRTRGLPRESRSFDDEAAAIAFAKVKLAEGRRIDAGVMQVTDTNWPALGLTVETVFDPAANVCAGAKVIGEAYRIEYRAACRYNTGRPDCTNGYPEALDRAQARLASPVTVTAAAGATPPPPTAPAKPLPFDLFERARQRREQLAPNPAAGNEAPPAGSARLASTESN